MPRIDKPHARQLIIYIATPRHAITYIIHGELIFIGASSHLRFACHFSLLPYKYYDKPRLST